MLKVTRFVSLVAVFAFSFQVNQPSIVLVDNFSYFEVHVTMRNTMYPKVCPMIRKAIFSGLKAAAEALRYNNSTPVSAFFCKCTDSPPHAATPIIEDDDCYLMCTMTHNDSGHLMKQHSVWLGVTLTAHTAEGKHCLSAVMCWMFMFCVYSATFITD